MHKKYMHPVLYSRSKMKFGNLAFLSGIFKHRKSLSNLQANKKLCVRKYKTYIYLSYIQISIVVEFDILKQINKENIINTKEIAEILFFII
jgi:hypothetical protein